MTICGNYIGNYIVIPELLATEKQYSLRRLPDCVAFFSTVQNLRSNFSTLDM